MHRYFLTGAIIIFFVSCTSNTIYKKPDDLIPKNEMVDLLTDMYLANAAKNIKTDFGERYIDYMPFIYEKYGVDSLRFHNSNVYYMSRLNDYEKIYQRVEAKLQEMLDTLQPKKEVDSILK